MYSLNNSPIRLISMIYSSCVRRVEGLIRTHLVATGPTTCCLAADRNFKLLDRAVSGARFLTGGVFDCDIAHHRSVAVLCMLYKIRCNPVHPLNGALSGPCVPVRVTCSALVTHWYTYAEPRSTAGLFFAYRCPSGMILITQYSMVWDWRVSRPGPMLFYWPKLLYPYYSLLLFFPFYSFCLLVGILGLRSLD